MHWLLSDVYPKSWTLQFPRLCQWAGEQKTERKHVQDSWPNLAKGIVHRTSCPDYKLREVTRKRDWSWLGNGFGISQQAVSNCIVSLVFLWSSFSVFLFLPSSLPPSFCLQLLLVLVSLLIFPSIPLRVQEGPEQLLYDTYSPAGVKLWQSGRYGNLFGATADIKSSIQWKKKWLG